MASDVAWLRAADPAAAAGERLAEHLAEAERTHDAPRLAIPGGSALDALAVARGQLRRAGTFERVRLTWVDERCVPSACADSNRGTATRQGLLEDPPPAQVLALFRDEETGAQAVERVEAELRSDFGAALDVVLLGMGEDGHVASLFPGMATAPGACAAHVTRSPKPPPERITLTRPLLETARHTVLLATGEAKRDALARLAAGDATLPAHGLPGLTVVTDLDLATLPGAPR